MAGSVPAASASRVAPSDDRGEQTDRDAEVHGLQILTREVAVHDRRERPRDEQSGAGAEDAADEAQRARLDEEDAPHVAIGRADGLEHADLAAAFADRGEHRVGDPEGGDREADEADAGEHELDDVHVPLHLRDQRSPARSSSSRPC